MITVHFERVGGGTIEKVCSDDLESALRRARHLLKTDTTLSGVIVFDETGLLVWSLRKARPGQ